MFLLVDSCIVNWQVFHIDKKTSLDMIMSIKFFNAFDVAISQYIFHLLYDRSVYINQLRLTKKFTQIADLPVLYGKKCYQIVLAGLYMLN